MASFSCQLCVMVLGCMFHLTQGLDSQCRDGIISSNSYCLRLIDSWVTWEEAKKTCKSMANSRLLNISHGTEMIEAARRLIKNKDVRSIWISAHSTKRWSWLDGSEIVNFDWAPGEPNAMNSAEDKIMLLQHADYLWNDGHPHSKIEYLQIHKAVCEYHQTCSDYTNPNLQIASKCYSLVAKSRHDKVDGNCWRDRCKRESLNYNDAKHKCESLGGRLAILNTLEKSARIRQFIRSSVDNNEKFAGNYWIGAEMNTSSILKWDVPIETTPGYKDTDIRAKMSNKFCGKVSSTSHSLSISAEDCNQELRHICVSDSPAITNFPMTSPCTDQNITVYTDTDSNIARVQLADGITYTNLPEGTYTYETLTAQNLTCITTFHVINNKTDFNNTQVCSSEKENVLPSSLSGEGSLDITCGDVIHRLRLPMGSYKYDMIQENYNCSTTVKVTDYQLVRRLNIKAEYDIRCALLSDPITKSMVISVADSHSTYIDGPTICGKVCKRQKEGDIKITCVNDRLSIMWPTDLTYTGDVTEVPSSIKSVIGPRLSQFGSQTPQIIIMKLQPPVVRPVKTDVVLVSSCQNNKIYVEDTDSCV